VSNSEELSRMPGTSFSFNKVRHIFYSAIVC